VMKRNGGEWGTEHSAMRKEERGERKRNQRARSTAGLSRNGSRDYFKGLACTAGEGKEHTTQRDMSIVLPGP
jgi:hypothetical protein